MLQVGSGDARHQRLPMQPDPGAALEVVEAEFLLELLVDLLADPACLDRADQDAPGRTGRQVREVEFALTRGTPLAHLPDLVARQMAVVAQHPTVAYPHAGHGEAGRERTLRALAPRHAPPWQRGRNRLGLPRLPIRHGSACSPARAMPALSALLPTAI